VNPGGNTEHASSRVPRLAPPLCCDECGTLSKTHAWGWRGYRMDDPEEDEFPALAFYCPICAEREFGNGL
jgi:hypothetical protein